MRFTSVAEIYEVFQRDRPDEWLMSEDEYLDLCRLVQIREPIVPARVRQGRRGEQPIVVDDAVYWPDDYYEELWLEQLAAGEARLLGRPIRIDQ